MEEHRAYLRSFESTEAQQLSPVVVLPRDLPCHAIGWMLLKSAAPTQQKTPPLCQGDTPTQPETPPAGSALDPYWNGLLPLK